MNKRTRILDVGYYFVIVIFLGLVLFPIIWMLSTAIKPNQDIIQVVPRWIPAHPTLDHFLNVLREGITITFLKNSLFVASLTTIFSILIGLPAGYAFSRYKYCGSALIKLGILATQMFPGVVLLISFYIILYRLKLLNTYFAIIISHTSFALPFAIWLMASFIDTLPVELEESAQIDGCSRLGAMIRVVFPLVTPGILATGFFTFMQSWDEYIYVLTLTSSDRMRTLPVGMVGIFVGEYSYKWGDMMACSLLFALPVLILFIFLQRFLIAGLTAGAVKE